MTVFMHTAAGAFLGAMSGMRLSAGLEDSPALALTTIGLLAAAIGLVGLWLGTLRRREPQSGSET